MINKRLLVKNLLSHQDENSFYDKKLQLDLSNKQHKAKFIKHVCALANSNPKNNSYIVIGVRDQDNAIVGVNFFDDAKIQNLVNAYLANPPRVQYENVPFAHLPADKVVGLVTIRPATGLVSLRKNIWKYYGGSVFFREGSISMPKVFDIVVEDLNSATVQQIENSARNGIQDSLDGVIDFLYHRHRERHGDYKVFKDIFILCWAGNKSVKDGQEYWSRVDIELINEQVRLYYSALDQVQLHWNEDKFEILEFVQLGIDNQVQFYELERQTFVFKENGHYTIETEVLFQPPQYEKSSLFHVYTSCKQLLDVLRAGDKLQTHQIADVQRLPENLLICHFNDMGDALDELTSCKKLLKPYPVAYEQWKQAMRILRKVKYA